MDRADRLMHGKVSPIHHTGDGLFEGVEDPFEATVSGTPVELRHRFIKSKSMQRDNFELEVFPGRELPPLFDSVRSLAFSPDGRLLAATGWDVASEFYYNDAGAQIDNLARSVQARCQGLDPESADWPEDGYRGEYIVEVARCFTGWTIAGKGGAAGDGGHRGSSIIC